MYNKLYMVSKHVQQKQIDLCHVGHKILFVLSPDGSVRAQRPAHDPHATLPSENDTMAAMMSAPVTAMLRAPVTSRVTRAKGPVGCGYALPAARPVTLRSRAVAARASADASRPPRSRGLGPRRRRRCGRRHHLVRRGVRQHRVVHPPAWEASRGASCRRHHRENAFLKSTTSGGVQGKAGGGRNHRSRQPLPEDIAAVEALEASARPETVNASICNARRRFRQKSGEC